MTSEQPWLSSPRPPTLEIPAKFDGSSFLLSDVSAAPTVGTLSPDIHVTSSPLCGLQNLSLTAAASVLEIGKYLLSDRMEDMQNGVAVYKAVHADTCEQYTCRVVPLDRCHSVLAPYTVVGCHPNIDDVREIIVGSTCAYVMHDTLLTRSEDLHSYVRRCRRLSEPEAARLFRQVLDAVAHCHRHGVVVRDIKLRRFLFADDNQTWLKLDGLYDAAVFDGSNDQLNDKHGCLAYVSPEILDATFCGSSSSSSTAGACSSMSSGSTGRSYSGRAADMWSMGVMLYTMLVGRYPFADTDACALFSRIRRGRYPMPTDVTLSPQARCLIRSLLTVKPEDRLTADEAVKHPWFRSVEGEQPSSVVASVVQDDSVVPQSQMEVDDDFTAD